MQAVAQLRAIITKMQCTLQKDVKYPLCMYFSLLLIRNRKLLLKKCLAINELRVEEKRLRNASANMNNASSELLWTCIQSVQTFHKFASQGLYCIIFGSWVGFLLVRHFWISVGLCMGLSGYPISWVVSLDLSAAPRLWPKHGYV